MIKIRCIFCGTSEEFVLKNKKVGCEKCYEIFDEIINSASKKGYKGKKYNPDLCEKNVIDEIKKRMLYE